MNEYNLIVFKDTGLHICFVPMFLTVGADDKPLSKHEMSQYGISIDASYQYDAGLQISNDFARDFIKASETSEWSQLNPSIPYIRIKLGHVVYRKADDANEYLIWGIRLALETNTGDNSRGYTIRRRKPTDKELARNAVNPTYRPVDSLYISGDENCSFPLKVLGRVDIQINVIWREVKHLEVQNVDIVLDFDNTRTCAILLEEFSDRPADTLRTFCRPLQLDNPNEVSSGLESAIVPSWFITHQAMFDNFTEDDSFLMDDWRFIDKSTGFIFKKHCNQLIEVWEKHPQMFGRNSLIKVGREAQKLYSLEKVRDDLTHGLKIEQSSPKRYYWDTDASNLEQIAWSMVNNDIEVSSKKSLCSTLNGELLRFLPVDGSILDFDNGYPEHLQAPEKPFYPRATTITLFLYDILEKAWSAINSSAFADNDTSKKRRINKLIATFPSGWSMDEIEKYKLRFQEAINIFQALNCRNSEAKIKLEMPLDEGAASQLPIIFSEIRKCDEDYMSWIEGNTLHDKDYVRVMNIDIGGGTTDVAIIEYGQLGRVSGAVAINSKLIFKDGSSVAGD
ncbi:MAG: virulence factor SrfB, partial [Victivallales bacterium]|nr:virulence factor SrfB [Victivallales bacterium]